MADENKKEDGKKKNGEFKVPPRTYLLWIAILIDIPLLMFFKKIASTQGEMLPQTDFIEKVHAGNIHSALIIYDPQPPYLHDVRGEYYKTDSNGQRMVDSSRKPLVVRFHAKVRLTDTLEDKVLGSGV